MFNFVFSDHEFYEIKFQNALRESKFSFKCSMQLAGAQLAEKNQMNDIIFLKKKAKETVKHCGASGGRAGGSVD